MKWDADRVREYHRENPQVTEQELARLAGLKVVTIRMILRFPR